MKKKVIWMLACGRCENTHTWTEIHTHTHTHSKDNLSDSDSGEHDSENLKDVSRVDSCVRQEFKAFLRESNLRPFASYKESLPRLLYDKRFTDVPVNKRKILFEKYVKIVAEELRLERGKAKHAYVSQFGSLLSDADSGGYLSHRTTLSSLSGRYMSDPRWTSTDVATRQRLVLDAVAKKKRLRVIEKEEIKNKFQKLINEYLNDIQSKYEKTRGNSNTHTHTHTHTHTFRFPPWCDVKHDIKHDQRYLAFNSSEDREHVYDICRRERTKKLNSESYTHTHTSTQKRSHDIVEASGWERKRARIHQDEQINNFTLLLSERVKDPFDVKWEEARAMMINDRRYRDLIDGKLDLDVQEKEYKLYKDEALRERTRELAVLFERSTHQLDPNKSVEYQCSVLGVSRMPRLKGLPNDVIDRVFTLWRDKQETEVTASLRRYVLTCPYLSCGDGTLPAVHTAMAVVERDVSYHRAKFIGSCKIQDCVISALTDRATIARDTRSRLAAQHHAEGDESAPDMQFED
eukprot:GHVR01191431.1.p1 GENE.GHVR01191431.1~~GHVR01191431.1.p1  ORF type:complete len:518 (-),score=165.16 GHVR01191431.1:298-1851(-)